MKNKKRGFRSRRRSNNTRQRQEVFRTEREGEKMTSDEDTGNESDKSRIPNESFPKEKNLREEMEEEGMNKKK